MTPAQQQTLNRVAEAEGEPDPYPTIGAAPTAGSYAWNVTPGESGQPLGFSDACSISTPGGLTAIEQASSPLTSQQIAGDIGTMKTGDIQNAYSSWQQELQQAINGGNTKGAAQIQNQLNDLSEILQSREQSPEALAQSLGLTPADLTALGF
jgi:hypothetical protein